MSTLDSQNTSERINILKRIISDISKDEIQNVKDTISREIDRLHKELRKLKH